MPAQLPLFTIARLCEEETQKFWQKREYDPQHCYALWRQALAQADDSETAYQFTYHVYAQQARLWVKAHRLFPAMTLSDRNLADIAFEKMWRSFANDPEKLSRFPNDPHKGLPKLLSFLKLCVHSVIVDVGRKQAADREIDLDDKHLDVASQKGQTHDPQQFWQCVEVRLKDRAEKIAIAATFIDGLPPRKVAEQFPDHFKDAQQVSQIKTRVFRRLRNDTNFQACLDDTTSLMHENR